MPRDLQPSALAIPDALRARYPDYFSSADAGASFRNPWPHEPLPDLGSVLRWKTGKNPLRPRGYRPAALPVPQDALGAFDALAHAPTRLFWIGHASFLVAMSGARLVIDPIFGRAAGLVARVTPPAALPEQLTGLTAVLVTHGHHDHLDPPSLAALARVNEGRAVFVVPQGLASALPSICRPIVELAWWQHVTLDGVRVHFVPAQHWHRRGVFDTNKALWGGYVLEGAHRVYHSGDTGYFGGFEAIGAAFGGIDAACLPLGAYEPSWFMAAQHMSPGDSVRAWRELQASHFFGMHWGTFDLSDEPVDAGPQLLAEQIEAERLEAERFHVLVPGGTLALEGARGATEALTRHAWRAPSSAP